MPRRLLLIALGALVVIGCAPPTPTATPTPTISVHEVFPPAVADITPQAALNCSRDREIDRRARLSPAERVRQAAQFESWGEDEIPDIWNRIWHAQALSCWAWHASDEQYIEVTQAAGRHVVILPSEQRCVEEAMGLLEGITATAIFLRDGVYHVYSDSALECFPREAVASQVWLPPDVYACSYQRRAGLEESNRVSHLREPDLSLRITAEVLSCWAAYASDADYQRFREELGLDGPAKVLPSWQHCLEEAIGYEAVEELYQILTTPSESVVFPPVWSQCIPSS